MIPYEAILKGETNDSRFEKFCRILLEKNECLTLVPTSKSWDQGRDGVSIRPSSGTHSEVLCCTINGKIEEKIINDAKRLAETKTVPEHVYYCFSLDLSDHKRDELTADFRAGLKGTYSVSMLGVRQIAAIAERHSELFRDFYHAEVRGAEASLQAFAIGQQQTSETRGLRLALLAFASDDAKMLRRQITVRAILDVLYAAGNATSAEIAEKLSSDLGLPKPLHKSYVESILSETTLQGLTSSPTGLQWELTDSGKNEAACVPPEAAFEVLAGNVVVRDAIERLVGKKIADEQWANMWSSLLDFFSEFFYTRGLSIISAVTAFINQDNTVAPAASLQKVIEAGAKKVRSHIITKELGDQIEQAIKDVFMERTGPAFDWLSRLCERFVALCSMGLEGTSSDEVRSLLIRQRLALDTDVILTCLCPSEPEHNTARELITRFREMGGKIVLSSAALEEVAYHAWIAAREFSENSSLFGKLSPSELPKYLKNTFVRSFFLLGWKREAKIEQWDMYIRGYRGLTAHEYSRLFGVMQTTLMAERLPDLMDEGLRADVTSFMKEAAARWRKVNVSQLGSDELGKAQTDGKILGAICAARENLRQQGSQDTVSLLSSSGRLRRADQEFRSRLATPNAVMAPAALTYLMSLIPSVNLGLGTLRRALFEYRDSGRLADTQRLALRVLRATDLYNIAWATRGTLEEHLTDNLNKEAKRIGERVETVREKFAAGDESVNPAQLIMQAVRDMAVSDKREEELKAAERRIADLEAEIHDMKKASTPVATNLAQRGGRK